MTIQVHCTCRLWNLSEDTSVSELCILAYFSLSILSAVPYKFKYVYTILHTEVENMEGVAKLLREKRKDNSCLQRLMKRRERYSEKLR